MSGKPRRSATAAIAVPIVGRLGVLGVAHRGRQLGVVFPRPRVATDTAVATTIRSDLCVPLVVGMALRTMSDRLGPPPHVLLMTHRLKMGGIDTGWRSAKMVKFQAFRHRASEAFVQVAMSTHDLAVTP
jgi:hypothetical protein